MPDASVRLLENGSAGVCVCVCVCAGCGVLADIAPGPRKREDLQGRTDLVAQRYVRLLRCMQIIGPSRVLG